MIEKLCLAACLSLWIVAVIFAVWFGAHDQLREALWSILIGIVFLLGSAVFGPIVARFNNR